MSVEWLTAPPEPVLDAIEAAVRDGGGAVLIGPAGVGKSTLAGLAADRLAAALGPADRLIATPADAAVPFAACGRVFALAESGRTADVLREARAALGDGRLLIIDDAQYLDRLSATLVYQLAVSRSATLIVTVSTDSAAPEAVTALWRDNLLRRIDVEAAGHDTDRLAGQIARFVAALPADAARVLQFLSVAGTLPAAQLATLAGPTAVEQAVAAEVAVRDGDAVRPAHPLYCAAARVALTESDLRRLRTDLAGLDPPDDVVGRLRWTLQALDSDAPPSTPQLTDAAEDALRLGDLELCERFGRAAVTRADGSGLAARLPLAYALAFQGRGREADAVLAEVDSAALAEDELMAWALPRAANQFWMLSQPERAMAFLRTVRERVSSPTAATTLDALSATFAMNAGRPHQALQTAAEVLASPAADDTAIGWAGAAAALSAARMGRFDEVDALAERAISAGHPGLLRFTSGFGQTTTLQLAGELDRALTLARRLTEVAQLQQPGRAIGELLIAEVLITRGDLDAAVPLLRAAVAALTPTGYSWGPLAAMLLARALGEQGAAADAAMALSRAESRHGLKSMLFAPELALARAWTRAARGDSHGAVAAAREAARAAGRGEQRAIALRALHDAVRLGDIRAVDGITRLGTDCAFGALALRHARALTAGDADGLDEVAAALRDFGMPRAGGDAAAQAHRLR
ncbi:AAA family ATPase [Mycolicibacterium thermoresistibile]